MKRKFWDNIQEDLQNNIFNKEILNKFINEFYETIVKNISVNQHILFNFRIELINKDIKTVTKLLKINNENKDKNSLISYLMDSIDLTNNNGKWYGYPSSYPKIDDIQHGSHFKVDDYEVFQVVKM